MWNCGPRPTALPVDPSTSTPEIIDHDNASFNWGARCDRILQENHAILKEFSQEWTKWDAEKKAKARH